jgi:hypothetical protein
MSPAKIAEEFGTWLPFTQAAPLAYSIAAPESAANNEAGTISRSTQLTILQKAELPIPRSVNN